MVRHRVEPLVHRAVKLGLTAGEHVAHCLDAHCSLGLQPREFEQLRIGRLRIAPAQRPDAEDDQRRQGCKPRNDDRGDEREEIIGHPAHPTSIRRIRTKCEQQINPVAGRAAAADAWRDGSRRRHAACAH